MYSGKSFYLVLIILILAVGLKGQSEQDTSYDKITKNEAVSQLKKEVERYRNEIQQMNQIIEQNNIEIVRMNQIIEKLSSELSKINEQIKKFDENHYCTGCTYGMKLPIDCDDALYDNDNVDGVYVLKPYKPNLRPFGVYCMLRENKAWTVIQRRQDGSVDFNRSWKDYKYGFGNLSGEYWLGLDRLHELTSNGKYELWIEMETLDNKTLTVHYDEFSIGSQSSGYQLSTRGFTGNTKDHIIAYHNNKRFATFDETTSDCPVIRKAGWWFNFCTECNLNGEYKPYDENDKTGLWWDSDEHISLKFVQMSIHPVITD